MPGADLRLLTDAARAAGQIALRFATDGYAVEDKPDGAGPVTEADLAVDSYLRDHLLTARPGTGWLSEETPDDGSRLTTRDCFIVDPIDGTRAFVDGARDWAHSLALVRNGQPIAAAVYLPRRDLMYAAEAGGGATLNDQPIRVSDAAPDGATVLANKHTFKPEHWHRPPPVERHFRSSLAYRLCLVGQGRFDGMATLRNSWHWDIAAGALIAREAGGQVSDRHGTALRFDTTEPHSPGCLAAGSALHDRLLHYLK